MVANKDPSNHNMDPAVVGSASFGQLFRTTLPGNYMNAKEQMYSQPLVYTANDGIQYVYVATTQNNLYKIDAKTGVIVAQRALAIPVLIADVDGCYDISPVIGITGTGVIDPETGTWYMITKTYADQTKIGVAQGRPNGRQILHAVSTEDLSERANFPVDIEGTPARNNPTRLFNGGVHHQRPALLQHGKFIYAGFGSHCVKFNFTGWIMGWDKTTGAIVEHFATNGAGVANTVGGGGTWMSGGGLTSDDRGSMFFSTGNGYAGQLDQVPVNGRNPPTALEEAVVHMNINDDGSVNPVDFFMPWEKKQLDGDDNDLGTTPIELLPNEFACGDVKRVGVITGKTGKTYFLNMDNLGGYRNGPNKLDDVLQTYANLNSVYAGAGVYPLEGGYIYINVIKWPTVVFKFSCNNGVPSWTKVAESPAPNAGTLGVGHGTVTSLNGQPGTGLVWTSDVNNGNLRIYKAVPENGLMVQLQQFNIPYTTKFTRPVFGDGRAYMGTTNGYFYGFGSPVNTPFNCTTNIDFGTLEMNSTSASRTVTCTAKAQVVVATIALTGNNFVVSGLPSTPLQVVSGGSFTFQASFKPAEVGPLSSDVVITSSGATGYSTTTPVTLRGTGQSSAALLSITPRLLSFPGAITGADPAGLDQTVLITNQGNTPLVITSLGVSTVSNTGPFTTAVNTSTGFKVGAFTFIGIPATIAPRTTASVRVNFDTSVSGNYISFVQLVTNGGTDLLRAVGVSGRAPAALIEFQSQDGASWIPYTNGTVYHFGNVTQGTTKSLKLRITNTVGENGAALQMSVSKPPFGNPGIVGAANNIDLAEGTSLTPGQTANATLFCNVPKSQWNLDPIPGTAEWTINTNDNTGKVVLKFDCLGVSEQSAPLQTNSDQGRYRYIGCFLENNPGRQLQNQYYGAADNTIAKCTTACGAAGAVFCGTQYQRECWGGRNIPVQKADEINCNFPCTGDLTQSCGGNGEGLGAGRSYISLFADIYQYNSNGTVPLPSGTGTTAVPVPTATGGPIVNPGVGTYGSIGCYTEATTGRALPNGITMPSGTRNVSTCIAGCSARNFLYAGLEYGQECWCGNAFSAGSVPAPIAECKTPCGDNKNEYCGGSSRLNVYQAGTYGNNTSSSTTSSTTLSSSSTTVRSSTTTTSIIVSSTTSSSSSSTTVASSTTSSSSSSTTTSVQSSTTTTSSSVSATPTGPSIKQTVGSYSYQGCYTEATTGRALKEKTYANDSMTLESCASFCTGFNYFGTEYARECYCGNTIQAGSIPALNQADCSFLCAGDKTSYCGGSVRLQMYKLTSQVSTSASSSTSTTSSSSSSTTSSPSSSSTTTTTT